MAARYTVGFARYFIVLLWRDCVQCETMWDASHSGTQSCARARANSTMQNIRTAFVLLGTVSVQLSTIVCNARALFLIVLNQCNAIPSETFACPLFLAVLGQAIVILSNTIRCNGIQCAGPPPSSPHPYPYYYYTFSHRKICVMYFVERCSSLVRNLPVGHTPLTGCSVHFYL